MDDHAKKLFAQLDDDFPGVRVQALDSLREYLKKAGQSFRDILHEMETSVSHQVYTDLKALHDKALADNAAWAQRDQGQVQEIASLKRQVAVYKGLNGFHTNWKKVGAWVAGFTLLFYVGNRILRPSWPAAADSGLQSLASSAAWGERFDRPFIAWINNNPYWVMLRGQVDEENYVDRNGNPVTMRCLHVFAEQGDANSGQFFKPHPYALFGLGWLTWPERTVQCSAAPQTKVMTQ